MLPFAFRRVAQCNPRSREGEGHYTHEDKSPRRYVDEPSTCEGPNRSRYPRPRGPSSNRDAALMSGEMSLEKSKAVRYHESSGNSLQHSRCYEDKNVWSDCAAK